MMRNLSLACLGATLCTAAALAQAPLPRTTSDTDSSTTSTSSPVAWVYVSSSIGSGGKSEIFAYDAASNGKLTPIAGSPFADDVSWLSVNGKYLFGSETGGGNIDAYLIASDGALSYVASTDVLTSNGGCGSAGQIFLDHTGASLYNFDYFASECANNTYQSFEIGKNTGKLSYMGESGGNEELNGYMTILANDKFAYSSDCYHFGAAIYGFKRESNGSLTQLNINPAYPTPPAGVSGWCPYLAKADTSDHLAIPMFPSNGYGDQNGPYQLAVYTADSSGNLTTTSTYSNMPAVEVGGVTALSTAPSGKLLAVAGSNGLQIFHFNGASPITKYTGLLTTDYIDQMFWDNDNHLYAISESANKLWVFTVTPTSHTEAFGSPHTIHTPLGIIVQPLPRY
jgi:6-phosphogluconolactonase (cycloisomerase 2 family)